MRTHLFHALSALIGGLTIVSLTAGNAGALAPPPDIPPSQQLFTRALSRGMRHADIELLQRCLARDVTLYPQGVVTGYFGTLTEGAVQRFQARYLIISSGTPSTTGYGRVGPLTRTWLNVACKDFLAPAVTPVPSAPTSQTTPVPAPTPAPPIVVVPPSVPAPVPAAISEEEKANLITALKAFNPNEPLDSPGPGGCATVKTCQDYCANSKNLVACLSFISF